MAHTMLSWNHGGDLFFLSSTSPKTAETVRYYTQKSWWSCCFTVLHAPYNKEKSIHRWSKIMVETCFHHRPPPLKAIKGAIKYHVTRGVREVDTGILRLPPWLYWFLMASHLHFRGGGSTNFTSSTMKSRHITQFKQNFSSRNCSRRNKSSSVSSTFSPSFQSFHYNQRCTVCTTLFMNKGRAAKLDQKGLRRKWKRHR